ncbi:hypothetical protein BTA51_03800 [Hahella sp. CCB-MM4]|uniref:AraC family transcriptional regulator n=1 Tax=Hahella sp. (strain CCB-MM4) TaxID=1926491 RepID=UPI000B9C0FFA|nr:AraC family transcriptional regulator ligand-binding domain-containing protein [Hahella sp. CCB-MM4]OZG74155.1 hypothetical protein BTA51_03800 [Hahella sp. CCB-MM4]
MMNAASISHLIEPGINAGYVRSLLDYLKELGLSPEQVWRWIPELGPKPDLGPRAGQRAGPGSELRYDNGQEWVKARFLNELYSRASEWLDDPHIGLRFGHRASAASFRMVGFLAASAPDLLSALKSVLHYQSLYSRVGKMVLRQQENYLSLCWDAIWPRQWMAYPAVEASIAGWHHLGLNMLGHRIKASRITFRHKNRGQLAVYESVFDCPVFFECEHDAIYLNPEDLECPMPQYDPTVHEALLEKSDRLLAIHDGEPIVDRVEQVLAVQGRGCLMSIEEVADTLSLQVGELRRMLKRSQLGYRTLCDRAKFRETLDFLDAQSVDFTDIALQLGFSEQSVFTRAFRRWTDMSPSAYRNKLGPVLSILG